MKLCIGQFGTQKFKLGSAMNNGSISTHELQPIQAVSFRQRPFVLSLICVQLCFTRHAEEMQVNCVKKHFGFRTKFANGFHMTFGHNGTEQENQVVAVVAYSFKCCSTDV